VLVDDEISFMKTGAKPAGIGRQYSGTAGRIANCQSGAFFDHVGREDHALNDRDLYLPEILAADAARRQRRLCRQSAAGASHA
jgi:SRSO17 transposase